MFDTPQCPECGDPLEDDDGLPDSIEDGALRVAIDCPSCGAPLAVEFDDLDPRTGDVAISIRMRET
ncbi:hypothetical protein ACOZ4I_20125 (plasmid) [Haloarcula salina]|uniref:hypothetical protein n=1 Tax=Haloarcula salina TaxID=1429914 RepID=UPI003C702E47